MNATCHVCLRVIATTYTHEHVFKTHGTLVLGGRFYKCKGSGSPVVTCDVRPVEVEVVKPQPQTPCPTCGCRLYKESGPCAGEEVSK